MSIILFRFLVDFRCSNIFAVTERRQNQFFVVRHVKKIFSQNVLNFLLVNILTCINPNMKVLRVDTYQFAITHFCSLATKRSIFTLPITLILRIRNFFKKFTNLEYFWLLFPLLHYPYRIVHHIQYILYCMSIVLTKLIKDQAFSRSYDLAPPTPSLPSPATHRKTEKDRQLAVGKGGSRGEEPHHTAARKLGPV